MLYEVTFPVRYYEADPMGIVHHSEYIRYFEIARDTWLKSVGFDHERCMEENLVFPVLSLHCDYKVSAKFGEDVRVTAEIVEFTGATITFHQQVINPEGRVCADGEVKLGFINTKLGHVVRCPESLKAVFDGQY